MINEAGEGGALSLSLSLSLCVFSPTIYGIFSLSCRIVGAVQPELMRGSSWPQVWQGQRPYRVEATAERDQATKFDSIVWKLICGHNGNENGKGNGWERERGRMGLPTKNPVWGVWAELMWIERGQHGQRHRELSSKIISVIVLGCLGVVSPSLLLSFSPSLYLPLSQFNEFLSVFLLTDLEIISFTRFLNPLLLSL